MLKWLMSRIEKRVFNPKYQYPLREIGIKVMDNWAWYYVTGAVAHVVAVLPITIIKVDDSPEGVAAVVGIAGLAVGGAVGWITGRADIVVNVGYKKTMPKFQPTEWTGHSLN